MDTLRMTLPNVSPDVLITGKGAQQWNLNVTETGEVSNQHVTLFLNQKPETGAYNGTIRIEYDHQHRYLNVSVSSVPAMLYGTSLQRVTFDDIQTLSDVINEYIAPYTYLTVNSAMVTRYDSDTLWHMLAPAGVYIVLLDQITRNKQYHANKTYYQPELIQFRTKTRTVGLYDKYGKNIKNEVERDQIHRLDDAEGKDNLLRYEVQHKNSKAIRQVIKQPITLDDVKQEQIQLLFLEQRKQIFNKLFPMTDDVKHIENTINTFEGMKTRGSRTQFNDTILMFALQNGLSPELMEAMMKLGGYSRQAVNSRRKQMAKVISRNVNNRELYSELKGKIDNDSI